MKKEATIRALLGTTQLEMAMLLQISRAQWSMYESGKRNLPSKAVMVLSGLLVGMQNAEKEPSELPQVTAHQAKLKTRLLALLKENQFQLQYTNHKIASIRKKYEANVKALQFAAYLSINPLAPKEADSGLIKIIEMRAANSLSRFGLPELELLQLKTQLLKQEELLLNEALSKLS